MEQIDEEQNEATLYWKAGGKAWGKALYISTTSPALAEKFASLGYILVGGSRFGEGKKQDIYHFLAHTGCLNFYGAAVRSGKQISETYRNYPSKPPREFKRATKQAPEPQ